MADLVLTLQQRQTINNLTADNTKDWWKAYSYTYSIIKDDPTISKDIRVWFQKASEINSNDPYSAANSFIRNVTVAGLIFDGNPADPQLVQTISNNIGKQVVEALIEGDAITSIDFMLQQEISRVLQNDQMNIGGWGGAAEGTAREGSSGQENEDAASGAGRRQRSSRAMRFLSRVSDFSGQRNSKRREMKIGCHHHVSTCSFSRSREACCLQ